MERTFFVLGCLGACLGVGAGAFGAHALKGRLSAEMLAVYQTGVQYQLVHALGLIAAAWMTAREPALATQLAGWLFVAGIVLFSGSLYVLATSGVRTFGIITPLGGVALLVGWLCLAWGGWTGLGT